MIATFRNEIGESMLSSRGSSNLKLSLEKYFEAMAVVPIRKMGKNLGLPLISATKLYRNNQNEYVPKLDLLTKESAKVAQEVITNALNLVYSARVKLQGQSDGLDKSVNFLSSTISVTNDASRGYLDEDLVEAASNFATALKSILAAVFTLQDGAKVADAGLEIIKSAA